MSWSNIYMQLITPTGPVLGEGMLEGFQTSIELKGFHWGMKVGRAHAADKAKLSLGGALKSIAGVGGKEASVQMQPLEITKRFDISSAMIHTCLDNHLPIISASITVLNIKQGGRAIHQPGFTLVATDGYFSEVDLDLRQNGNSVELVETITLNFKSIVVTYLKRTGKDNVPTNPFMFKKK